jgi:hypothetical protein
MGEGAKRSAGPFTDPRPSTSKNGRKALPLCRGPALLDLPGGALARTSPLHPRPRIDFATSVFALMVAVVKIDV